MIRVGVFDVHPIVLWGLEKALADCTSIAVTCTASSETELVLSDVDVLMLDMYLGKDLPSTALVMRFALHVKVIMMSATRRIEDLQACFAAGASGFIHKSSPKEEFVRAIRGAAAGNALQGWEPQAGASAEALGLSRREQQVVTMVGAGLTHDQIARRLGVSKNTVDTYIKRVRGKLSLGNKAELAFLAHRLNSAAGPYELPAAVG